MSSEPRPTRPARSCPSTTVKVRPCRRSSAVSPTHRIGVRPWRSAAARRLLISSSVSRKTWRRSEWPSRTSAQPRSTSIGAETSPVNAPLSSQWQFCAPSRDGRAREHLGHRRQRRERRTHGDLDAPRALEPVADRLRQRARLAEQPVHLPVADDERSPHRHPRSARASGAGAGRRMPQAPPAAALDRGRRTARSGAHRVRHRRARRRREARGPRETRGRRRPPSRCSRSATRRPPAGPRRPCPHRRSPRSRRTR